MDVCADLGFVGTSETSQVGESGPDLSQACAPVSLPVAQQNISWRLLRSSHDRRDLE